MRLGGPEALRKVLSMPEAVATCLQQQQHQSLAHSCRCAATAVPLPLRRSLPLHRHRCAQTSSKVVLQIGGAECPSPLQQQAPPLRRPPGPGGAGNRHNNNPLAKFDSLLLALGLLVFLSTVGFIFVHRFVLASSAAASIADDASLPGTGGGLLRGGGLGDAGNASGGRSSGGGGA